MTLVVSALAIVVAVLAVLVAGLLRSHAAILRRLHELGAGVDDTPGATPTQVDLGLPQPPSVAGDVRPRIWLGAVPVAKPWSYAWPARGMTQFLLSCRRVARRATCSGSS
jgi:hypothetical protein